MPEGSAIWCADGNGHVRSDLTPWDYKDKLARVTEFGGNVAIRCYMHSRCSFTRRRARISNEALMRWLFGVRPPGAMALPAEVKASKDEHARLALSMLTYEPRGEALERDV